jgi:hypothetical protein
MTLSTCVPLRLGLIFFEVALMGAAEGFRTVGLCTLNQVDP